MEETSVPDKAQLDFWKKRGAERARTPVFQAKTDEPTAGNASPPVAIATHGTAKKRWEKRQKARIPNGKPAPNLYRASQARPPPHIACLRPVQLDAYRRAEIKRARERGYTREAEQSGLPSWAWVVYRECLTDWRSEIKRLPGPLPRRLRAAADTGRTPDMQRSIATVGLVLTWLSLGHPRHLREATNVGGLPGALLACLTQRTFRGETGPYSLSALQHANHVSEGPGSPEDGTAGILETLRQFGVLDSWVPPAQHVPDWMRGEVYAFCVFRVARAAWTEPDGVSTGPPFDIPDSEVPY